MNERTNERNDNKLFVMTSGSVWNWLKLAHMCVLFPMTICKQLPHKNVYPTCPADIQGLLNGVSIIDCEPEILNQFCFFCLSYGSAIRIQPTLSKIWRFVSIAECILSSYREKEDVSCEFERRRKNREQWISFLFHARIQSLVDSLEAETL